MSNMNISSMLCIVVVYISTIIGPCSALGGCLQEVGKPIGEGFTGTDVENEHFPFLGWDFD